MSVTPPVLELRDHLQPELGPQQHPKSRESRPFTIPKNNFEGYERQAISGFFGVRQRHFVMLNVLIHRSLTT